MFRTNGVWRRAVCMNVRVKCNTVRARVRFGAVTKTALTVRTADPRRRVDGTTNGINRIGSATLRVPKYVVARNPKFGGTRRRTLRPPVDRDECACARVELNVPETKPTRRSARAHVVASTETHVCSRIASDERDNMFMENSPSDEQWPITDLDFGSRERIQPIRSEPRC